MASTGDADRKRHHLSSNSPTGAATMAKKPDFTPLSEDKKLDTAVLQFQNQKLSQKLEVQKMELDSLENRILQRNERRQSLEKVLTVVNNSWSKLLDDLGARAVHFKDVIRGGGSVYHSSTLEGGASSSAVSLCLKRLTETGPIETCLASDPLNEMIGDGNEVCEKSRNILRNVVSAVDDLWHMKEKLYNAVLAALPDDGSSKQNASNNTIANVKKLHSTLSDLHMKHRSLVRELHKHEHQDLRSKVELQTLRGDLECVIRELEDSNHKLAALKAEKDATKGTFFPVLSVGNKHISNDKAVDNQKDLQDLELKLKEAMTRSSSQLQELNLLHEERIKILEKLSNLQGTLKNVKHISCSRAFQLVKVELEKSKADVIQYQALYEKLQADKDKVVWKEREAMIKTELDDVFRRSLTTTSSRIDDLETEIQRQNDESNQIETKLEEALREPGRKEIISKFKEFVSSFPEEMSSMQSKLCKYKEAATDVHSLRAEVQSLTNILDRKAKELEELSSRSADQDAEIQRLQTVVQDLKDSDMELNLIAEMYRRESIIPRNYLEARDKEYKAWAHVHSLTSSLDEHNMEIRVKEAIEAEAISQQRLAAAEAEIADLRLKCKSSEREKSKLLSTLRSKNEENEAYLSEIETIGQAYYDMQNQNQSLLQQVTERDDYNIKVLLEGLHSKQTRDLLLVEKQSLQKKIQQGNSLRNFLEMKAARIEDQVKSFSDQIHRAAEDRSQNSVSLENIQKRLSESRKSSQQAKETLEELQSKVKNDRANLFGKQIELERERFGKKRLEEELEAVKRKPERLKAQKASSVAGKLQKELQEYKEILKCSVCIDRPKEVVITKCYHLLCNPCVQKVLETRHRKCPVCAASFGPNDVKPVYI